MKKLACFAGSLSLFSLLIFADNAARAQGGDPVGPPVNSNFAPVNTTPTVQGPTFLQFIQQQQQIQTQIQNINFPPYLQANPTISPLDQRSGLTSNSVKVINLNPISLGITTIKVPNIINSSLLAPSSTVVSNISTPITTTTTNLNKFSVPSITIAPNPSTVLNTNPVPGVTVTSIPTVTTITTTSNAPSPKPDFSGLSNLLNNLSANQKATGTVNTTTGGGYQQGSGIVGGGGNVTPYKIDLNDLKTSNDPNLQNNLIQLGNVISGSDTSKTQINQAKKEVLDAKMKQLESVIDASKKDLVDAVGKIGDGIDKALQQLSNLNGTTSTTTTTSSGDKLVTTVRTGTTQGGTANNTNTNNNNTAPAEKDFLSKLTDDFTNFPASGTPQQRQAVLQDMVKTLTNAQKLGLIPANAKDDLAKLVTIAGDPNNPAYKSNDTTTIKFYLSSVLSKTSTVVEGMNKTLITSSAINAIGDPTSEVGKALTTLDNTFQSLQNSANTLNTVSETQGNVRSRQSGGTEIKDLQDQINAIQTHVAKSDTATMSKTDKVVNDIKSVFTEVIPGLVAPGAARASAVKVDSAVNTASTSGAAPKAGTEKATPAQTASSPNATVKTDGNAPPVIPTVDMTGLQNTFNTQTNTLGDINGRLETKQNSLTSVSNAIKNFVPTATNKGQLDMYKSQQQKLTAEIGALKSDKGMAESKMLTTFSQMYGATAATNLSKVMLNTNMSSSALQAAANSFKP